MIVTGKPLMHTLFRIFRSILSRYILIYTTQKGPKLCAGEELAATASKALGKHLDFENISEYVFYSSLKTGLRVYSSRNVSLTFFSN